MPLYEFVCEDHGTWEMIASHTVERLPCPDCGEDSRRIFSLCARTTAHWGDSDWGINGKWDAGLGQRVFSRSHQDRILRERGLVRESDLGGDNFVQDYKTKAFAERDRLDKVSQTYTDNLKKYNGDKMKAVVDTFPAHEMLAQSDTTTSTGV